MDDLLKLFLFTGGLGIVGSLIGVMVAMFGKQNESRLRVSNASGIGFLAGASLGAVIGIFQSLMNQF